MTATALSPLEQWKEAFQATPSDALDRLLARRAFLGSDGSLRPLQIVERLFGEGEPSLDEALREWLQKNWGSTREGLSASLWALALEDAFLMADRLNLDGSWRLLRERFPDARGWLRRLYIDSSRDPEGAYLDALARRQKDRSLLQTWLSLCKLDDDLPLHYASIGILGLRKLPDGDGSPPRDLPEPVFQGVVELAESIVRQVREKKHGRDFWELEVRALMASYPRNRAGYWADHFYPHLYSRPQSEAARWLSHLVPPLRKKLESRERRPRSSRPTLREREMMMQRLQQRKLGELRSELASFLNLYRRHAYQTGDAEPLVKTFCNVANQIYCQDPIWALELLEDASQWAPLNPRIWTQRAAVEAFRGRTGCAEALLWKAKRKFPHEAAVRNQLAELLSKHGHREEAHWIYVQTCADFPKDPFCRSGLAELLRETGRQREAEQIYRQAVEQFQDDPVFRTGLAKLLRETGRLQEAEQIYRQAVDRFDNDSACRNALARLLRETGRPQEAEQIYRLSVGRFRDDPAGPIGLATLLGQEGKREEAAKILKPALSRFPDNEAVRQLAVRLGLSEEPEEEALSETSGSGGAKELAVGEEDAPYLEHSRKEKATGSSPETPDHQSAKTDKEAESGNEERLLGLAQLWRFAASRQTGKEKARHRNKAFQASQQLLQIGYAPAGALLESGWWLAQEDRRQAESYFERQASHNPNVLGFQVGLARVRQCNGRPGGEDIWQSMIERFPNHRTLLGLEKARQELGKGNGTRLATLEDLRRSLRHDLERLPLFLQGIENWLRESIATGLFAGLDLDQSLSEDVLAQASENCRSNDATLAGIAEECLSTQ